MSTMDEIEARAASKAIHTTIQMLEDEFNVRASGDTPKAKRRSLIRKLRKKFRKKRK